MAGAVEVPEGMRGATEDFALYLARSTAVKLGTTWGIGEAGAAGPPNRYGDPAGHCWVAVAGSTEQTQHVLTGVDDCLISVSAAEVRRWSAREIGIVVNTSVFSRCVHLSTSRRPDGVISARTPLPSLGLVCRTTSPSASSRCTAFVVAGGAVSLVERASVVSGPHPRRPRPGARPRHRAELRRRRPG